ncbi:restriction endonuclease [Agromyces luteolus]|uniref:Restriction endonuclease n=1 Tax=Agromyces luteolus TaxID=88373 RepID=A0A7C9HK26_9MICO|nr:restriction endonuclease [Agromyces luteolus]MUN08941.1 restriction endonuclease [Agromyces luteolus]GLK28627.1 restriction endonuclease [Agromyces luteolus]
MAATVPFDGLAEADLIVDAVYEGGTSGNAGDDPIGKLLPVGNSGGIRFRGRIGAPKVIALVTSGADADWPDWLDVETGVLTYFGDNKRPGHELHETSRRGNHLLRNIFDWSNGTLADRQRVPPILVFGGTGVRRNHRFLGLAVPGASHASSIDELVGIWRSTGGQRYQNYRALFTILDAGTIKRGWLDSLDSDDVAYDLAPPAFLAWGSGADAEPLRAPRTREARSRQDQEPITAEHQEIVRAIHAHFATHPYEFEQFAASVVRMYLSNAFDIEVTRPSRDGGRDAVGRYRVGTGPSAIEIDFAVEAKCYRPGNSVGVREMSRLISRMRHRQFGIMVTTSHVDKQAYSEIKEDGHPIVVLSGRDIAEIIHRSGVAADGGIDAYLQAHFPRYP